MSATFPSILFQSATMLTCGYRSKVCTESRAIKLDGSLHKLCEFHRQKANLNQQKLHRRHRLERALLRELSDSAAGKSKSKRRRRPVDTPLLSAIEPLTADDASTAKLCTEDMAMLELLLFDMQSLPAPLVGSDASTASWIVDDGLFAGSQAVIV